MHPKSRVKGSHDIALRQRLATPCGFSSSKKQDEFVAWSKEDESKLTCREAFVRLSHHLASAETEAALRVAQLPQSSHSFPMALAQGTRSMFAVLQREC